MYRHPVRTGLALLAGSVCSAIAGFLFTYGAIVGFERPLETWYHKHNH